MVYLQRLGVLVVLVVLSVPAYADRGNTAYKRGVRAEQQSNFDAAFGFYKQANSLSPKNAKYFIAYSRMRAKAAELHVRNGQLLLSTGALKDALTEFQHAAEIDSTNFLAQQELRQTADMIRRQERQRTAPKVESPLAKLASEVGESVELQPISDALITFHMAAANADSIYRTIGKMAGINVLIDPEYRPQKINIDLNNVTLLQALDMLRVQSKTFWRPVAANTIYVAADSPGKRKDLEENVMKTFYLQNVSTPQELQEAANVVSKLLDVNRVQLLQSQDALIVRGTKDQLVLVDKLLSDIDKPKSEVVIDVAVMQVTRSRTATLGAIVPTAASIAYLGGKSGGSGSGTGGGYTTTVGSFGITVSGASFQALAGDTNSKVLQNPQIRVLQDGKATLRIGDRVPIATGSFAAGLVGGGSVSPLISTQFQYLDVGVNIDITPHIHANRDVTLKLGLEISALNGVSNIGGVTQPIIGQRRIEHETRLADGEVNILGGILTDSESQSLSGLPWVSKIPLLKYLFAQETKDREQSEIVFAITPHIVRGLEVTEENLRVVDVGTGSSIELHRKPPAPPVSTPEHLAEAGKPRPSSTQTLPVSAPVSSGPAAAGQPSPQNKP